MNPDQFLDFILHLGSYVAVFWYGWWARSLSDGYSDTANDVQKDDP